LNVPNAGGGLAPFARHHAPFQPLCAAGEELEERDDPAGPADRGPAGDALEEAARGERDYVRRRLAEELGREPGEEELNEWLRRHTEGY